MWKGEGRNSVRKKSVYEKKNYFVWTGDPVEASSLYLCCAEFYRLFKIVHLRIEENNQNCPSIYNGLKIIVTGGEYFCN